MAGKDRNLLLRNGTYYARFWVDGREVKRSLQTPSRAVALKRLAQMRQEALNASQPPPSARKPYAEAVVDWWAQFATGGALKPRTAESYRLHLANLDRTFGGLAIDQIDRRAIGRYVAARRADGVTNATIRRGLTVLSSILTFAVAMGWADGNAARDWDRRVIREVRPPQRPPSDAQIATLTGYMKSPMRELVAFAAATGMRLSEVTGLDWGAVDMERGTITLIRTKANRPRILRMVTPGGDARAVLERIKRHPLSDRVFWRDGGAGYRTASKTFAAMVRRAMALEAMQGRTLERFRFHDLRHAFAIRWLMGGGDIYALSRHLGHTSVKTTEIYLKWLDPDALDGYLIARTADRARTGPRETVL